MKENKKHPFQILITEEQYKKLKHRSEEMGSSMASLVRIVIQDYLEKS